MDRARGVDVSHHHPVTDFGKVIGSGISFFGAKCSEGNTVKDKTFRTHRDGARQQPFTLCVWYHFARAGDPKRQAERFMDLIGPLRANERLCLDLEGDDAPRLAWIDLFYGAIMKGACSDRRPLLYTSARIWEQIGNPKWDLAAEVDLWIPRYGSQGLEPKLPDPWKRWCLWQYSDGETPPHTVPGVQGPCDGNYFNGDVAALREYAKLKTA